MRRESRACVIRRGSYPTDPRLHRTVRALLEAGYAVDVICRRDRGQPARERRGPLSVRRVSVTSGSGGVASLLAHYALFFAAATGLVTARHVRRPYDLIHVQSLPDTLVFAAAVPRLLGARVVLDLAECWPEYFGTRFGMAPRHPGLRLLGALEQLSIRFADRALTCTVHMRDAFVRRGADAGKIGVVLNAADESVFDVERHPHRGSDDGGFVLVCHGLVEARYGIDTVIRAVAVLANEIPGLRLEVYGTGTQLEALARLALGLDVADRVWFSRAYVPIGELLEALARADAGVVAVRRDAFRDLTHTNKMFDLIAMQVPVIASRTSAVQAYFGESCFEFFDSDDPESLAGAIRRLHGDPELRRALVHRASQVVEPYRWKRQRDVYLDHIAV